MTCNLSDRSLSVFARVSFWFGAQTRVNRAARISTSESSEASANCGALACNRIQPAPTDRVNQPGLPFLLRVLNPRSLTQGRK